MRELKNLIERLAIMVQDDTIAAKDLPANVSGTAFSMNDVFSMDTLADAQAVFKAEFVRKKLPLFNHDIEKTSAATGVDSDYIRALLEDGNA